MGSKYPAPQVISPPKQNAGQLQALAKISEGLGSPLWPDLTCGPPHWVRMQRLLSGPWVPGGGVSGQVLAAAPDGKLVFSGGHWDGSLRVTSLPRGKLLKQLSCHLGMCSLGLGVCRWE